MEKNGNRQKSFLEAFNDPPRENGEVPFYWWTGDKLNKERLKKQLAALAEKGVAGVQVNYAHMLEGGENDDSYGGFGRSIPGDPIQFSEAWWEFFGYAAEVCESLGMGIGVGDYTLAWIGNGFFTDRVAAADGMAAVEISCERVRFFGAQSYSPDENVLALVSYDDVQCSKPVILYERGTGFKSDGSCCTDAFELRTRTVEHSINPMAPGCGQMLTEIYFKEFERRFPNLKNGTLNYFFQDELMFGCNTRYIWSELLRRKVNEKFGYDPIGFLPHIFFVLGDVTPKIRLDIADVRTQLSEDNYFRPIYDFHASRGLIYGCDQSGRGKKPDEFSDYFRCVRWFTAPGNDTPGRAADLIKVKVNSSIAHLYHRPRVWLEGYHSSGWGTTLESITAATDDNFIFGANLLNLHGLYYSALGGFFEWAPPDFHFRMPYWDDEKQWLDKYKRLSALLTTGAHRCDAAVFYPVSSCDYGENAEECVKLTFDTAEELFRHGIDFDFIDFQSIERAKFMDDRLCTSDEKYRALIFCGVDCIRYGVIKQLKKFLDCGGYVFFCGITPYASDRAGLNDEVLKNDILDLLSHPHCRFSLNAAETVRDFDACVYRSFLPEYRGSDGKVYVHRRVSGKENLYFVRYAEKDSVCRFEAVGTPYAFDIENNKIFRLTGTVAESGFVFVKMPFDGSTDTLILFSDREIPTDGDINTSGFSEKRVVDTISLNDWNFELLPTLDNSYGDFYLPAGGTIGAQARFFDCAEVSDTLEQPIKYKYKNARYCVGHRIYKYGEDITPNALKKILGGEIEKNEFEALPIHDRYGYIYTGNDFDKYIYEQGFHGLKGKVFDDNFFFDSDGIMFTSVYADSDCEAFLYICGVAPDRLYVNSRQVDDFTLPVKLHRGKNTVIAAYVYDKNKCPDYRNRSPLKRSGIHFVKKKDFTRTGYPLSCASFANSDFLPLSDPFSDACTFAFTFVTPPGFFGFEAPLFGELVKATACGAEMKTRFVGYGNFGEKVFRASCETQHDEAAEVTLFVTANEGMSDLSVIPEPIDLFCGVGKIKSGDISKAGALCCYSGKMRYSAKVKIRKEEIDDRFMLNLGKVGSTARVVINGGEPIVFTHAPFEADVTELVENGENSIEITVSNTLSNHYSTVPSRYSNYPEDAASGLIGPVTLTVYNLLQV